MPFTARLDMKRGLLRCWRPQCPGRLARLVLVRGRDGCGGHAVLRFDPGWMRSNGVMAMTGYAKQRVRSGKPPLRRPAFLVGQTLAGRTLPRYVPTTDLPTTVECAWCGAHALIDAVLLNAVPADQLRPLPCQCVSPVDLEKHIELT
jgi:hypothetical protein